MFLYIDALFDINAGAPGKGASALSTDDPEVRDTPPYDLRVRAVTTATPAGEFNVFTGNSRHEFLSDLGKYLSSEQFNGSEVYVGWFLDQTVIPAICANAMLEGVDSIPNKIFRRLDDKWSKTYGQSVERAFVQGWYPETRGKDIPPLTLDRALGITTGESLKTIEASLPSEASEDFRRMAARLSAISRLHCRYTDILSGRSV